MSKGPLLELGPFAIEVGKESKEESSTTLEVDFFLGLFKVGVAF